MSNILNEEIKKNLYGIVQENIDDYEASGSYGTICLYAKIGEEKIATLVGAYNNKDDRDEVLDVMKILERSVNMS